MRLFVALDLPPAVRRGLAELGARLSPFVTGARWTRPEDMHVTLKFIGHIPAQRLPEFRTALARVRSTEPVELRYQGIRFLSNPRSPRVLYCGVNASPNLAELAAAVERTVEPLGIARESRGFVPHLTLARLDSSDCKELVSAVEGMQQADFGIARETELHLYESMLKSSGAEYKKLQTYSFVKETRET